MRKKSTSGGVLMDEGLYPACSRHTGSQNRTNQDHNSPLSPFQLQYRSQLGGQTLRYSLYTHTEAASLNWGDSQSEQWHPHLCIEGSAPVVDHAQGAVHDTLRASRLILTWGNGDGGEVGVSAAVVTRAHANSLPHNGAFRNSSSGIESEAQSSISPHRNTPKSDR